MRFEAAQPLQDSFSVDHPLPVARIVPEASATVWYWSNRSGAKLSLRLMFPRQIDPRTRRPLEGQLEGDIYTQTREWQQLTSQASTQAVEQLHQRLRGQLSNVIPGAELDLTGAVIIGVTLHLEINDGNTDVLIDDLELSPFVPDGTAGLSRTDRHAPLLELGDDRVSLEGRPTILRFTPYHGESLDLLEACGFNVIWIRDLENDALLEALAGSTLRGIVAPPLEMGDLYTASGTADPIPFDDRTASIVMFNLGLGINAGEPQIQELARRADLVRTADVHFERHLMADVQGNVREFHRNVDFVGFRWDILHTEAPPAMFANFLEQRRRQALPGKPTYTWVASEASPALLAAGQADDALPSVEAEQVFWQAYTALGAGCKGLGFFKHIPFDDPAPGTDERRLAVSLLNMHISLLERWLATGKPSGAATVQIGEEVSVNDSLPYWARPLTSRYDGLRPGIENPELPNTPEISAQREIRASMIDSEYGRLVLLNWHHPDMCFQPGRMTAENVRVLVPGDWTQAWLVTTTCVHPFPLELTRTGGGTEVKLRELNQFAAIVLTDDRRVIEAVSHEMQSLQSEAADAWVELADLKHARISQIHSELAALTSVSTRGNSILTAARSRIDRARLEYGAGNFDESRQLAQEALMWLRMLQHEDWHLVVGSSQWGPASTPFSCSFQTLPQHVRMRDNFLSATTRSDNLLLSGSFDDYDAFRADDWTISPGVVAEQGWRGSLVPTTNPPGYCLRVEASPSTIERLSSREGAAVIVESPPVHVQHGQVVAISGKIRITSLEPTLQAGVLFGDSELGIAAGRRWFAATQAGSWESFTLLRKISRTGDLTLRMEMHGAGQVELDDVQVISIEPGE